MDAAETFDPSDLAELFAGLSREPDFDAPELQAHDSADELILVTAVPDVRAAAPGEVVVIGDHHGALTLGAAAVLGARGIRVHQDPLLGERALRANAERLQGALCCTRQQPTERSEGRRALRANAERLQGALCCTRQQPAERSEGRLALNADSERVRRSLGAAQGVDVAPGVGAAQGVVDAPDGSPQNGASGERVRHADAEQRAGLAGAFVSHGLDASLLAGARVVLLQLPRGLDALDEIAWSIARWADPAVRVYAGGRVKHMTRAQNDVLGRYFADVSAGLGRRKARVLTASAPLADVGPAPFPRWGSDPELPFRVAAHGATFGGPVLDHGSRLLLAGLDSRGIDSSGRGSTGLSDSGFDCPAGLDDAAGAAPRRIVDLGCGNGSLAVSAALRWPEARVIATDQSSAAVAATRLTAEAAGVLVAEAAAGAHAGAPGVVGAGCADRTGAGAGAETRAGTELEGADAAAPGAATRDAGHVDTEHVDTEHVNTGHVDAAAPGVSVRRADALEAVPDGWADLILLNPPFHTGATVHAGVAHRLIRACARALAPGGELRLVFNSHLRYRPLVERAIGPTREVARDRTFTVLSARLRVD